jgi:1,4-dihydroxy-2-naphthoate polyprenyltransferase
MLHRSTIQLLRFHFSFFLLPVFLFAISELDHINTWSAIIVFFILHFLVYPASNGYNSYMDRDTGSIGGLKNPPQPLRQLFYLTMIMDILAFLLSMFVSYYFAAGILLYILVSRAYSYRGIRLKKYPIAGYLTVVVFQGAFTFLIVYHGSDKFHTLSIPLLPALISSLLIGGFYPLTQVYQHEADVKDGVKTISYLLGYRGTFIFCGIVYSLAMALLFFYFNQEGLTQKFLLFITIMLPVPLYFLKWAIAVWKNTAAADFNNTMKMNVVASVCTNIAFISLLIWKCFE